MVARCDVDCSRRCRRCPIPLSAGSTNGKGAAVEAHVLDQEVIPYETPRSLDALGGPAEGVMILPRSVYWGPDP